MVHQDAQWERISLLVAEAFRLSISELESLRQNPVARLVGTLPVIAGCRDADRIGVTHLSAYLVARRCSAIFDHRVEDDREVLNRLERISHFSGGDSTLIERGMNLLALTMVACYQRDVKTDRLAGVYNPVGSGAWDVETIKTQLIREIRAVPAPRMDEVLSVEQALAVTWNG